MSVGCDADVVFDDGLVAFDNQFATFDGKIPNKVGLGGVGGFDYNPKEFAPVEQSEVFSQGEFEPEKPIDVPFTSDDDCSC